MPEARSLLHQWVCDLCGQPLAGPDERCNSGIHQGPDDLNGWRGKAVEAPPWDPGSRVQPTFTTWGPGEVIPLERAAELAPRDYEMACRAGGDPDRFVWVLHDTGSVGGWYADSLVPA